MEQGSASELIILSEYAFTSRLEVGRHVRCPSASIPRAGRQINSRARCPACCTSTCHPLPAQPSPDSCVAVSSHVLPATSTGTACPISPFLVQARLVPVWSHLSTLARPCLHCLLSSHQPSMQVPPLGVPSPHSNSSPYQI
jgi:hypothetical protein